MNIFGTGINKYLRQPFQAVSEQAVLGSAMFFNVDSSDYAVFIYADFISPTKGLWAIVFHPDEANLVDRLYFAAGPNGENDGLFGYLAPDNGNWKN